MKFEDKDIENRIKELETDYIENRFNYSLGGETQAQKENRIKDEQELEHLRKVFSIRKAVKATRNVLWGCVAVITVAVAIGLATEE